LLEKIPEVGGKGRTFGLFQPDAAHFVVQRRGKEN
jgi:hypothetical protein